MDVRCDWCGARDAEPTCLNEFTFVRCRPCGLVYLDPRPAADELDTIYPPEYEPFHFHESRNPLIRHGRTAVQRRKAVAIAAVAPDDATILDIGCGSGQLLELLRRHGRPGWRLVGNDFSEVAVRNLERLGLEALSGRFEEIETPLRVDVAILNQAIEHLERPSRVLVCGESGFWLPFGAADAAFLADFDAPDVENAWIYATTGEWKRALDTLGIDHSEPAEGHLGWYVDFLDPDGLVVRLHTAAQPTADEA